MKKYTQGRELTAGLGDTEEHISQSGRQNNGNHPTRTADRKTNKKMKAIYETYGMI